MTKISSGNVTRKSSDSEDDAQAYKPVPFVEEILVALFFLEIFVMFWFFSWKNPVDWSTVEPFIAGDFSRGMAVADQRLRLDNDGDVYSVQAFGIAFPVLVVGMIVVMGAYIELSKTCCAMVCLRVSRSTTAMGMVSSDLVKFDSPLDNPVTMKKFREQGWQLSIHVLMTCIEYVLVAQESPNGHLMGPDSAKLPWEQTFPINAGGMYRQPSNWLVLLYATQIAIWMYTAFVCWAIDERKKDYLVMMAHHVVTIALILGSAWCGHLSIGLMVLWVHDSSDIFVDGLKMINYLGLDGLNGFFFVEASYLACLGVWFYARLFVFPTIVLHSASMGSARWAPSSEKSAALGIPTGDQLPAPTTWEGVVSHWIRGYHVVAMYTELNVLLMLLQGMHVWWFFLIVRLGFRMMAEGNRSASEKMYEGKKDKLVAKQLAAKAKCA